MLQSITNITKIDPYNKLAASLPYFVMQRETDYEKLQGTQRSAGYLVGKHRRANELRDEWYFQNLKQKDKYSKFAVLFSNDKRLK